MSVHEMLEFGSLPIVCIAELQRVRFDLSFQVWLVWLELVMFVLLWMLEVILWVRLIRRQLGWLLLFGGYLVFLQLFLLCRLGLRCHQAVR